MPGTTPAASQLDWLIPSTGAILFEGDQRTAQVINLGHGGTSIGFRTTTTVPDLCRRPHSFWTHSGHTLSLFYSFRISPNSYRFLAFGFRISCVVHRPFHRRRLAAINARPNPIGRI